MTEADYVWLTNENLPDKPVIRVVAGSVWHYAQGGWVETDPVPELTAADIEAEAQWVDDAPEEEEPVAALAPDEQEPDPETPAEEES